MWGAVEVDSDAMGSVWVCGMHTTISRRVRYITINHGVRIQHQPWVSIVDIYWYTINIEHVIFVDRVVEEGPDTTAHSLCLVSRGVYNRGEGFRQSEGGRVFYVGGEVVLWYITDVYGFRWGRLQISMHWVPCVWGLRAGDWEHAERYVRQWHIRKENNRCDHGTEQIRVSHYSVCNNKV